MLNIFYGRENLDKEKFIFDHMAGRALIMVPDQYTLEAERQAFRHLGISALMDVEIVSPSSLGENILNELGGSRRNFINKYGRHMILYKSAAARRNELQVFRGLENKASFIDAVNNFISEMKQYGCGPKELAEMIAAEGTDDYTGKKLADINLLFNDYESQIKDRYTDSEDRIDLYLGKIRESELIRGNQIWVYGFDSFAPKTMALLGELMSSADEVNLLLTWDDSRPDADLFELTGIVMHNAVCQAQARRVPWKKQPIPKEYELKDLSRAMRHIEKELYTMRPAVTFHSGGITMVEAAGIYNEAESAAAYVLSLVRDKGLRYRDIRLVCNDMEKRRAIIERVFEEYGIEVYSDIKRDITDSPVIRHILALLDTCVGGFKTEALMRTIKSGFGDLTGEEAAALENYAIKYKIKGSMWKKPFRRGKSEYGEEGLTQINQLRRRAVEPVLPLEKLIKAAAHAGQDAAGTKAEGTAGADIVTTGNFIRQFYDYLCVDLKLREKVLDFIGEQEDAELYETADETASVWKNFASVLDQIYDIMGGEPFEPEMFLDILMTGLRQVEIGLLPPAEDALMLGTIQRSRSSRVKALVVMGVNEGILPQEKPTQGLFSAEERELFKEKGRELCKVDSIRFMEEKLAIYRNLSQATEYLWMSCALSDEEGNQLRPSHIFTRMKELFPELAVQPDVLNRKDKSELINSRTSGLRHLSRIIRETIEGGAAGPLAETRSAAGGRTEADVPADPAGGQTEAEARPAVSGLPEQWAQALSWLTDNKKDDIGRIRDGLTFTNKQEDLGRAAAEALFKGDTASAMSLSPSRIENFARCPFAHLVTYGLRPEERRIFEAAPREIGDVYHRCLMRLTHELTREGVPVTAPGSPWMTVTREECFELARQEIKAIAEEYREGLFNSGALENYRRDRLTEICGQVCYTVVEQVRKGRIDSIIPEVSFGRRGVLPPIEVDADGRKVYIEGIIDRVDYLEDGRVKIVDYKTGNESFDMAEAAAGYRLQLMIYLQAACGSSRKPAGVFYFKIREPQIDMSGKDMDQETLEAEIRKTFKLDGIMVDNEQVIGEIAGDFSGFSEVVPIRATKEGIKNTGREGLVPEEDFRQLRADVADKVSRLCADMLAGKADIHPMKTKDRSACTFCRYKGICRFDTVFEGCSYNIIS